MISSKDCWMQDTCSKLNTDRSCLSEDKYCPKLFKINNLFENSLLSKSQRNRIALRIDADGTDKDEFLRLKEIQNNITDFVLQGKNLYLWSTNCGNGKTAWAERLIQVYINNIWYESNLGCRALFISVPRFLLSLKDNISAKNDYVDFIKEHVLEADLVVWDEVVIKSLTNYEHENLLNIINTRLDLGKSNIYTSNLSLDELYEKAGNRLYSRIINLSEVIQLNGKDKRGIIG